MFLIHFSDLCTLHDMSPLHQQGLRMERGPKVRAPPTLKTSVKCKSDFYLVHKRGEDLDLFQKLVEKDLVSLAENMQTFLPEFKSNLNKKEEAMKNFLKIPSLVIKNAYKGGAFVLTSAD